MSRVASLARTPARAALAKAPALPPLPAPSTPAGLAVLVDGGGSVRRAALRQRVHAVVEALSPAPPPADAPTRVLLEALAHELSGAQAERVWLALAVVSGSLPDSDEVVRVTRRAQLDGPLRALAPLLGGPRRPGRNRPPAWRRVRVVTGQVVVDLHHTAATELATGIQRVARQTVSRWHAEHAPTLVRWDPTLTGLCELTDAERARALSGASVPAESEVPDEVLVPWRCTYVLPELLVEPPRAKRLKALLRWSGSRSGMIGFDCVPISSAETVRAGMGANFAGMLSAAAYADRVVTISKAAGTEYRGWRTMLGATGIAGPDVRVLALPTEVRVPTPAEVEAARDEVLTGDLPMVLCVGSHEPRKNHLAVLAAAEQLWSEGLEFSLVHVGGNAWRSERFTGTADRLIAAGRPLRLLRGLSDDVLMSAYVLARCTVFPSLNEGYGLPVAESLALGVPAMTSGYGSMLEIAEAGGGALLVDPRDDRSVTDGLRALLVDDGLREGLAAQAASRPLTTWDDYAAQAWDLLVGAAPVP